MHLCLVLSTHQHCCVAQPPRGGVQSNGCDVLGGNKVNFSGNKRKKKTMMDNLGGRSLKLKKGLRHRHGWLQQNSRVFAAAGGHMQIRLLDAAPVQVRGHPVHRQSCDWITLTEQFIILAGPTQRAKCIGKRQTGTLLMPTISLRICPAGESPCLDLELPSFSRFTPCLVSATYTRRSWKIRSNPEASVTPGMTSCLLVGIFFWATLS